MNSTENFKKKLVDEIQNNLLDNIDYDNDFLVKQKVKIYKDILEHDFHELQNPMNRY